MKKSFCEASHSHSPTPTHSHSHLISHYIKNTACSASRESLSLSFILSTFPNGSHYLPDKWIVKYMAVAVAVPVAGLKKRFFNQIQKRFQNFLNQCLGLWSLWTWPRKRSKEVQLSDRISRSLCLLCCLINIVQNPIVNKLV